MDNELVRKLMEVFSSENQKLKMEIEDLKRQLVKSKNVCDDKLLAEVFANAPEKLKKAVRAKAEKTETSPLPAVAEIPKLSPAPIEEVVPELPKKGRPKTSTVSRDEYQKKYQAEYRSKKRMVKLEKRQCDEMAKQYSKQ